MIQSALLTEHASQDDFEHRRRTEHLLALRQSASPRAVTAEPIAVRMLSGADQVEVERIAGLDSAAIPGSTNALGAEVDGRLVAALFLDDGSVIADPFERSSAAIELLRLRARQLGGAKPPRRRLRWRAPGAKHALGGLPGSPPGAGGRLLQL